jgi:hypothetical protein
MNNKPLWYPLDNFPEDIEKNINKKKYVNREMKKNYDFHRKLCLFLIIFLILFYMFLLIKDENFINNFKNVTL